jgi:hypothetical protein
MYGIIYTCMHSVLNVLLELKISMTYYLTQTNDKVCKDLLALKNQHLNIWFIGPGPYFI